MTTETRATHTPGPWRYEPDFNEVQTTDAAYLILARIAVGDGDYNKAQVKPDEDERHANGRLMAAAPALLAALQQAKDYVREASHDHPTCPCGPCEDMRQIRSALLDVER